MKKALIIVGHPNIKKSIATSEVITNFKKEKNIDFKIVDLYNEYPDFKIDIEKEQNNLLEYNNIIILSPIYWYNLTPMVKQYIDLVCSYGFAYGAEYKLENKKAILVTSTGGTKERYEKDNLLETYLKLWKDTFSYMKMDYDHINNFQAKKEEAINIISKIKKSLI